MRTSVVTALLLPLGLAAQVTPCDVSLQVVPPSCPGDANAVITVITGSGGPYTYSWAHDVNEVDAIAAGLSPGPYQVFVLGDSCESLLDTVVVNPVIPPLGSMVGTNTSCAGANDGTITLTLNPGPYTFTWAHDPNETGTTITGLSPGWYTAFITGGAGCPSDVAYEIGDPSITITGDVDYCPSDPSVLTAELEWGFQPDLYVWSSGDSTQVITVVPPFSGQIDLTATDTITGCVVTASFTVNELPSPTVAFAAPDTTCQNVSTLVQTISSTADSLVWRWGTGLYGFSNQNDPLILFTGFGWQPVQLQGYDSLGCGSAPVLDSIYANWQVPAVFTAVQVPCTPLVDISLGSPSDSCAFFVGDSLWTHACNGYLQWNNQRYDSLTFTLYATQPNGCNDTLSILVDIRTEPILVYPNAFTPNDDNINDRWPDRVDHPAYGFELMLFNRWGELLWTTRDPNDQWDGTIDGKQAPEGVYIYTVRRRDPCEDKREIAFRGHVTIVR